jgi:hypothetical protein
LPSVTGLLAGDLQRQIAGLGVLVHDLVLGAVLDPVVRAGPEPVVAAVAPARVGDAIVDHRRAIQHERAIGPAPTEEVVDAGGVAVRRGLIGQNG